MNKPFIVVTDGMSSEVFDELKKVSEFEVHPSAKISQDELKTLLPKANALVIRSATKPNQELINQAPNLKYIIRAGEGTDNIDKAYCAKKGIKVSNTPGANNNSAGEHALALMLTLLRKTAKADADMKKGNWNKNIFKGFELTEKTVGIIGFGRIGQILAKRLAGFEPEILFYDPHFKGESPFPYAKQVEELRELCALSDIISVHVPKTKDTTGLINSELLNVMKEEAILINAARGGIVNEKDLIEALKDEKIAGAGLDVFESEPLPANSELLELENVLLTPHLGGNTVEAQLRVGQMALHQLKEFFLNDHLLNEVKG